MNHEHYYERIDFVKSILQLNNLEVRSCLFCAGTTYTNDHSGDEH